MIKGRQGLRRVIPRWRSPIDALKANEGRAALAAARTPVPIPRDDLLEREGEWLARETRGVGLDLISVAATTELPSAVAKDAAQRLLDEGSLSGIARRMAERIITPTTLDRQFDFPPGEDPEPDHARREVRRLRRALFDDPHNAFAWAEQARMYVQIGQTDPAKRAMRRALALAPSHRYLLRAAARLAIHLDEPDRAQVILLATSRTSADPWLAATEISASALAGRSSKVVRAARSLLIYGSWSPGHLTELASALATAELDAGRSSRARDLFLTSLEVPNDNALAQAESVGTGVARIAERLRAVTDEVPKSYEARSLAAASDGRHDEAVEKSALWLADQPFSAEPAAFGSYHAAEVMDFERSLEFAKRGLIANPGDLILRNNAAFALAKLNRPDEARRQIHNVDISSLAVDGQAMILATEGLIAFRKADPELGQTLYVRAIDRAESSDTRIMATIMMVAETLRLRLPGAELEAAKVRARAEDTLSPSDRGWLHYIYVTGKGDHG